MKPVMIESQPQSDKELVIRHMAGDRDALGILIKKYTGAVYSVVISRIRDSSAVEDLVQQTFLTAVRSIGNLKAPEKFGCWIYGVARNTCMDWLRENRKYSKNIASVDDVEKNCLARMRTAAETDCDFRLDELKRHVADLPEEQQEVLNLLYSEKMSYKEMSEMLDVSTATINKRLTLARNSLRQKINGALSKNAEL
ncbi:MAG: sigma-70 family RNA polymerase sigma factor [Planctomycetes bacterium]|nr:sigma-70 family RNA polymerase sigma factor [Planctomycetota bacterium]